MNILKTVRKVPGGLAIIPLLIAATINTFFPAALEIGGFTSALFKTGATAFIALFVFASSASIDIRKAGVPVVRGGTLVLSKLLVGIGIGWVINKLVGPWGILGVTPLAIISAMTQENGGLYIALANEYGDESDVATQCVMVLNDGPLFTMIGFGATGMADIPLMAIVATLIPALLGMILGTLDKDIRDFTSGADMLIPFFCFCIGANLNFGNLVAGGIRGIVLGAFVVLISGLAGYFFTRLYSKRLRAIGAAVGSTAGSAVATPALLAAADPNLAPFVASATAQVAGAVIVTALLCPLLVSFLNKRALKRDGITDQGSGRSALEVLKDASRAE